MVHLIESLNKKMKIFPRNFFLPQDVHEMDSVENIVNNYLISLYGDILDTVVISAKRIEIRDHKAMRQELTQCCGSRSH